ncbi:MAG: DNA-protecting protein DprA [Deltaproteobacteria bacterium]|nr:DNA-protecting protein DprA [Deltaproteobacteria bacterium]
MTDKLPWLALRRIPGVGLVLFHRLVQAFGSPGKVFQAAREDLRSIKGVSPAMAQAIAAFREWGQVEAEISGLRALGAEMLTWEDPAFPPRLKEIPLAPPFIFVQGTLEEGDALAVAMVGTRTPSYYGLKTCRRLAGALAFRGLTVVSGLARGIDTAAHQGALENSGRTLAVLGCGLDVVYPPENRELYQRIPEHGALISEFPLGAPPEARNFPVRNRLISGLSLAVVVVEAGVRSGTSITVSFALEQGREVMAVPGAIDSPTSVGPHRLIQEGAKLVMGVEDILQELPEVAAVRAPAAEAAAAPLFAGAPIPAAAVRPARFMPDDPLLPLLGSEPVQLEELVQSSRLPAAEVMSRLTMLELQGLIRELPGKCYVLEN